jgi:hypothetical protein
VKLRGRLLRIIGWVALGLALALFIAGFAVIGTKTLSPVNSFIRVSVPTNPNGVAVQFDRTGKWVAYYEASNVESGIDQVPAVPVAIQDPSGQIRRINTPFGNRSDGKVDIFTYDYNGHKGVTLYQFNITQPGRYLVATQANNLTAPDAKIAFGKDITGGAIAGAVMIGIAVGLGILAVILLIIGYVKRSNHKGELRAAGAGYGVGPGPGYGGPGPAYGGPAPAYGGPPPGYGAPQGYPPPGSAPPPGASQPPAPGGYQPPAPGGYQPPPPGSAPPEQPRFGEEPPSSGAG